MAQYDRNIPTAFAGLKATSMEDHVESFAAEGAIEFGRGVGSESGNTQKVRAFANDNAKLVFDADFVTSNKINGKVNGVSWTEVDFDTDHDTTAANLAAAIAALTGVTCVLDSTDANKRTFLIENTDGSAITVTDVAVTGGASQAGSTVTTSSDDIFRGISLHQHNEAQKYENTDTVSVLRKGQVWCEVSVAVSADEAAYVDVALATGKMTNVSTNNVATNGVFRSTTSGAGLAIVEINLP
jgi:hypothetical protein